MFFIYRGCKRSKNNETRRSTYFMSPKAIPNYNVMGVCKSALEASVKIS